jgi:hypothetical protein
MAILSFPDWLFNLWKSYSHGWNTDETRTLAMNLSPRVPPMILSLSVFHPCFIRGLLKAGVLRESSLA